MNKFKIKKLPNNVINHLVSNELINDPACVLKELIENSIDAESSKIIIYIEKNGIDLVKVIDDGIGIYKDDIKKACLRYNTSKIHNMDDLNKINTYGFRGEALFAIKAMSDLEIISKPADQKIAWKTTFNNNSQSSIMPASLPDGTSVSVRNILCHNSSSVYENSSIFDRIFSVFKIIALSQVNIHFILLKDGIEYCNLLPCFDNYSKIKRIKHLIGKDLFKKVIDINSSTESFSINGFFSIEKYRRPLLNNKFFYINNRFVNDNHINDFINEISKPYISKNESLYYCFYLYLDPSLFSFTFSLNNTRVQFKTYSVYSFIENTLCKAFSDTLLLKHVSYNKKSDYCIENKYDYFFMDDSDIDEPVFINEDKILTIIDNNFLFFVLDDKLFITLLKNLRIKILFNLCIKQFINNGELEKKNINIYKFVKFKNTNLLFLYKKIFSKYGFEFKRFNDNSVLLSTTPRVLCKLLVNWDMLINDLVIFFDNSIAGHLSTVRFEKKIIDIFSKYVYSKSPCYKKELNTLYSDLIDIKNKDKKWFDDNCFLVSCKKLKFN